MHGCTNVYYDGSFCKSTDIEVKPKNFAYLDERYTYTDWIALDRSYDVTGIYELVWSTDGSKHSPSDCTD